VIVAGVEVLTTRPIENRLFVATIAPKPTIVDSRSELGLTVAVSPGMDRQSGGPGLKGNGYE